MEIDPDVEDTYVGTHIGRSSSSSFSSIPIPIEAKLRSLCVKLLYEVCKVQTLSVQDLSGSENPNLSDFRLTFFFWFQRYLMMISLITFSISLSRRSSCKMRRSTIQ